MHLMYTVDANGKRLYTLKKVAAGEVTKSAHPARFSPDDKYSRYAVTSLLLSFHSLSERSFVQAGALDSILAMAMNHGQSCGAMDWCGGSGLTIVCFRHRITIKKRYGLLLTQQSEWILLPLFLPWHPMERDLTMGNAENEKVLGQ